jgi:hypothetical protein
MTDSLPGVPGRPRLAIPGYAHPALATMWRSFASLPSGSTVILDPASGPGAEPEEIYVAAVARVRAAGVRVHGYVDTFYGMHEPASIHAQVASFREWYGVDGIFLDRTAPSGDGFEEAVAVVRALRSEGLEVSMNPGLPEIEPRYAELDALVCNFEGPLASFRSAAFPAWARDAPGRFWHLVYEVPDEAGLAEAIGIAAGGGASAVYVTDGVMPNPWNGLPAYFPAEVDALRGLAQSR